MLSAGCCSAQTEPSTSKSRAAAATTTTMRTSRSNFAKSTTSALFPSTQFTNHESLPSLPEAFSSFSRAYSKYEETQQVDRVRENQYPHLSGHVCLDYTGFSLFSHSQTHNSSAAASSSQLFSIAYKSSSPENEEAGIESVIRKRIMRFLNIEEKDYSMLCTASRTAAFKLLAETYPFRSSKRLLTVYDHESEAVSSMVETGRRRGAEVLSASFAWPGLRIQSAELKRILQKKKKRRGLLVFPLQSRMTGARYPYLWMRLAQENGWHVALDTCALGPKELRTLGLSLIQPDFVICSFYRVVGENPSGFASLFVKRSSASILETSRSTGLVSIVAEQSSFQTTDDLSGTFSDTEKNNVVNDQPSSSKQRAETSEPENMANSEMNAEIECAGLDHAESLGTSSRLRYITNWLVVSLMKLRHPSSETGHPLVRIYGPRVKFERGPSIAFNVFDWKSEKVEPSLVQKLADRSSISLSCGFLCKIWFPEDYQAEKETVLERSEIDYGVSVVNASLCFLSNFEDAYKLWSFVAKFLDADFVEKERWRYMALNQTMVEV